VVDKIAKHLQTEYDIGLVYAEGRSYQLIYDNHRTFRLIAIRQLKRTPACDAVLICETLRSSCFVVERKLLKEVDYVLTPI